MLTGCSLCSMLWTLAGGNMDNSPLRRAGFGLPGDSGKESPI